MHLLRKAMAHGSSKERKALAKALKGVCRADSAQAARPALEAFRDSDLGRRCPVIARSWEAHWEEIVPFFPFTDAVRKVVLTTKAIEGLNSCVRCAVATRRRIPSDKAGTKLTYLAPRDVERKWKAPPPIWHRARREFAILFAARFRVLPRSPTRASRRHQGLRTRHVRRQPRRNCSQRAAPWQWPLCATPSRSVSNVPCRCATVASHMREFRHLQRIAARPGRRTRLRLSLLPQRQDFQPSRLPR